MLAGDQDVLAVRRGRNFVQNPRLADRRRGPADRVHAHQLGRRIVFEQILIVRILQQIFVGGDARAVPVAFLHRGTFRHARLDRRRLPIGRNGFHQQCFIVGQPFDRRSQDCVHFKVFDMPRLAGSRISKPELDSQRRGVGEREPRPIFRPAQSSRARLGRQHDRDLGSFRQLHQRDRRAERSQMQPIGFRVDANIGQPQHGRGHFIDPRIAFGSRQRGVSASRVNAQCRQRGRIEDVENFLGRFLINQLIRPERECKHSQNKQASHDGVPSPQAYVRSTVIVNASGYAESASPGLPNVVSFDTTGDGATFAAHFNVGQVDFISGDQEGGGLFQDLTLSPDKTKNRDSTLKHRFSYRGQIQSQPLSTFISRT